MEITEKQRSGNLKKTEGKYSAPGEEGIRPHNGAHMAISDKPTEKRIEEIEKFIEGHSFHEIINRIKLLEDNVIQLKRERGTQGENPTRAEMYDQM